jgi:lactoylglutathione lyase/methylmalonyl-CoA/ethylmalonyl-CoA epimerase
MAVKIEHIGVVVKNLEDSVNRYTSLLGLKVKEIEEVNVEGNNVKVAFLPIGAANIELVTTTAQTGLVADFLREKGEGVHHIAVEVEDIHKEFKNLRSQGVEFVWGKIINGSRGTKVAVIEQKELNGVYIELVQKHK